MGQGYVKVWFGSREKGEAYFGVLAQTSLGRNIMLE